MNDWRDAMRKGVEALHAPTNFFVTGGVDDVWESGRRVDCCRLQGHEQGRRGFVGRGLADWL